MKRLSITIFTLIFSIVFLSCQRDRISTPTNTKISTDIVKPIDTIKPTFTLTNNILTPIIFTPSPSSKFIPTVDKAYFGGGIGKFVFEYGGGLEVKVGVVNINEPENIVVIGKKLPANSPTWSSFYKRLYYSAKSNLDKNSSYEIYSSNIDGSDIRPITIPDNLKPRYIGISPKGNQVIVWVNNSTDNIGSLYKGEFDGMNISKLTILHDGGFPSWSPDGLKILFSFSNKSNVLNIYSINIDRTNLINLSAKTNSDLYAVYPTWSPDGSKILFNTYLDRAEVYEMNSDGSNLIKLKDEGCNPSFSPDGQLIAFVTGGHYCWGNIFVMKNDGTILHKITGCHNNCRMPIWIK